MSLLLDRELAPAALAVRVVPAPRCGYRAEMRFSLRAFRWCQGAPPPLSGPFREKGPEPGQVKSRLPVTS